MALQSSFHQFYTWTWKDHPEWDGHFAFLCGVFHSTKLINPKHCCPLVSITHHSGEETVLSSCGQFSRLQQCNKCHQSYHTYAFNDLMKLTVVELCHDKNLWYTTQHDAFSIELQVGPYIVCFKVDGSKQNILVIAKGLSNNWEKPRPIDCDLPRASLFTYFNQCQHSTFVTLQMLASQAVLTHFKLPSLKSLLPKSSFKHLRTFQLLRERWNVEDDMLRLQTWSYPWPH